MSSQLWKFHISFSTLEKRDTMPPTRCKWALNREKQMTTRVLMRMRMRARLAHVLIRDVTLRMYSQIASTRTAWWRGVCAVKSSSRMQFTATNSGRRAKLQQCKLLAKWKQTSLHLLVRTEIMCTRDQHHIVNLLSTAAGGNGQSEKQKCVISTNELAGVGNAVRCVVHRPVAMPRPLGVAGWAQGGVGLHSFVNLGGAIICCYICTRVYNNFMVAVLVLM